MLMGENSRELTRRLEERLEQTQASLPEGVELEPVYSRTTLVDQVLETVRDNLLVGALLVIAILFVFLGDVRAGLIVALAIPLSMLFAFNAMLQFGVAGSLMSLGAIDFGLVADSSVIMVENAARRVDEDDTGRSVREIVRRRRWRCAGRRSSASSSSPSSTCRCWRSRGSRGICSGPWR